MPKASMHGGMVGDLPPQPEMPAATASAHRPDRIQRRQMPQAEPSVGAEPTVGVDPGLVPIAAWPGPDHARPLAAICVDFPSPVPKNRFRRFGFSHVLFVPV
jgi:hypothetical protein